MNRNRWMGSVVLSLALRGSALAVLLSGFFVGSAWGQFVTFSQPTSLYTSTTTLVNTPGAAPDFTLVPSATDGIRTFTFSPSLSARTVPGGGWLTWGSPPNTEGSTPRVLFNTSVSPLVITMDQPVAIFGVEIEPNLFGTFLTTATFKNGATVVGTVSRNITGAAGALLAAASACASFTSVEISAPGAGGFAIARLRYSTATSALLTHLTHTVHGHTVQGGGPHGTLLGGAHHGQHGHGVQVSCGAVPHIPGHSPAGVTEAPTETSDPAFWVAVSEDGSVSGAPATSNGQRLAVRRGSLLYLFGSSTGLVLQPPDEEGLRRTLTLPDVRIGGVPAEVIFSGLAPAAFDSAWQLGVRIPEAADTGNSVGVEVSHDGRSLRAGAVAIE